MTEEREQALRALRHCAELGVQHTRRWARRWRLVAFWWVGYTAVHLINCIVVHWLFGFMIVLGVYEASKVIQLIKEARREESKFLQVLKATHAMAAAQGELQQDCAEEQLEAAVIELNRSND